MLYPHCFEPTGGFEPPTSSLPWTRSTPELPRQKRLATPRGTHCSLPISFHPGSTSASSKQRKTAARHLPYSTHLSHLTSLCAEGGIRTHSVSQYLFLRQARLAKFRHNRVDGRTTRNLPVESGPCSCLLTARFVWYSEHSPRPGFPTGKPNRTAFTVRVRRFPIISRLDWQPLRRPTLWPRGRGNKWVAYQPRIKTLFQRTSYPREDSNPH